MDSEDQEPRSVDATPLMEQETLWGMLLHLSIFTGFFSVVGFFLGPLIIWLIYRDRWPSLDPQFKEAMNFQISMFAYYIMGGLLVLVTLGIGILLVIPVFIVLGIVHILLPILAAIKAREGGLYRYPMTFRLVR